MLNRRSFISSLLGIAGVSGLVKFFPKKSSAVIVESSHAGWSEYTDYEIQCSNAMKRAMYIEQYKMSNKQLKEIWLRYNNANS